MSKLAHFGVAIALASLVAIGCKPSKGDDQGQTPNTSHPYIPRPTLTSLSSNSAPVGTKITATSGNNTFNANDEILIEFCDGTPKLVAVAVPLDPTTTSSASFNIPSYLPNGTYTVTFTNIGTDTTLSLPSDFPGGGQTLTVISGQQDPSKKPAKQ